MPFDVVVSLHTVLLVSVHFVSTSVHLLDKHEHDRVKTEY